MSTDFTAYSDSELDAYWFAFYQAQLNGNAQAAQEMTVAGLEIVQRETSVWRGISQALGGTRFAFPLYHDHSTVSQSAGGNITTATGDAIVALPDTISKAATDAYNKAANIGTNALYIAAGVVAVALVVAVAMKSEK